MVWPESEAVQELYINHHRRLVGLAAGILGDRSTAEDAVHDAFLATAAHLIDADDPYAYLRRSVVNGCRSRLRRLMRARAVPVDVPVAGAPPETDELWEALHALSPRRRTALVLRYYEDLPVREIADLMGCRDGTVSSLIHRGLADLRKVVERHD